MIEKSCQAMSKLERNFFSRPADVVAPALLGAVLSRRCGGVLRRARIIEVEAYLGPKDLASHASKGLTNRTQVLYGPPGRAYVYFIYGMHWMFNIVVAEEGAGQAVLVRGAEPLDGWNVDLTGPGKLARAFEITIADNGLDLMRGDLHLEADATYRPRIVRTKRIGIDYARHWKDRLLRFVDVRSEAARKLKGVKR
jgi:DNA-3-methyladenine glycosylase